MRRDHLCGFSFFHPNWLQKFASTKMFISVYGMLGTIQAMSYMYFVVTLTTIEKRFKIPSQTTGIILSGNEISQILLSLILSYSGGQRNRPRWIAWGMVCCSMSCFILALPHFLYGPGEDAIKLTKEYVEGLIGNQSDLVNMTSKFYQKGPSQLCFSDKNNENYENIQNMVPLILIFLSQFVLGIGNTLYYSLGQTYLDDNTKKTNTPLILACAMSLRMIGPIIGFFLGHLSLNMFIDSSRTPLVDNNDIRWVGAWWFGWTILGIIMLVFSGLIGLFPKKLPNKKEPFHSEMPKALRSNENYNNEDNFMLKHQFSSDCTLTQATSASAIEFPKLKDFPKALLRLLKTKLLMFNIIAAIFYILGSAGYMTFLTKYMEVQFLRSAQNATVIIGPLTLTGMVVGLLLSGFILSKKRPSPNKVLFWNVLIGFIFMLGQFSFLFLNCGDTHTMMKDGNLTLQTTCNEECTCDGVPYSPVCHEGTKTTFFSPCYAACTLWDPNEKVYSRCQCLNDQLNYTSYVQEPFEYEIDFSLEDIYNNTKTEFILKPGACLNGCTIPFVAFSFISFLINMLGSSGRIGNILVNYRTVTTEDKSFAQGLALMLISMFALIPGPIIFGRIIDSTCVFWNVQNEKQGHCQLYDQAKFRYFVNIAALALTSVGVMFDALVWYYGKHLDLYGEREEKRRELMKRKNRVTSPLL